MIDDRKQSINITIDIIPTVVYTEKSHANIIDVIQGLKQSEFKSI
jgi:hypothetical protein